MKQLDLLLVNAPSRLGVYGTLSEFTAIEQPVWAGLIARYCLNHGHSVEILDAEALGLNIQDTAITIMSCNPRLAVFCVYGHQPSASTQCLPAASAVAKIISEMDDAVRIPTMAIGTHMSALPERTLREEPFDYVCQGEGPYTVAGLLNELIEHQEPHMYGYVKGLRWKMSDGSPSIIFKPSSNIENLDHELPNQAWELLDMKRYRPHHWHRWMGDPNGGYAAIQTSLGCPYACTFCCINTPFGGSGYRMWSPANVAAQIANLVNRYSITNLKFPDEMFVLNRQHVWQICNHLIDMKLGDQLNIWCYGRIDTLKDTRLLDRMRQAGFKDIGIGIESASKFVRDGVDKGKFNNQQIIEAVNRVRAAGIYPGCNYIFGLPDDTTESMQETLNLACEINGEYSNFYCAQAYPGSPLHKIAQEKQWVLPESTGGPGWIGYSQHSYESLPLPTETLSASEVLKFRDEAWLTFHQRPVYLDRLKRNFGQQAVDDMTKILALGKPKRRLLGD